MTPALFVLAAFGVAIAAGVLGSLLGLGGGIVVVPALSLLLGVDIRYAIGASIVAVIATSLGATQRFLRHGDVDLRLGFQLELATVAGALGGASLAGLASPRTLHLAFAAVTLVVGALMLWRGAAEEPVARPTDPVRAGAALAAARPGAGRLAGGLAVSGVAGVVSGLLGVGGGFLKVPAMNVVLEVPLATATATSNFMIGMTAAASATVFFRRGDIAPLVAAPVALGVLLGAALGARVHRRLPPRLVKVAFLVVLAWIAASMAWKGFAR